MAPVLEVSGLEKVYRDLRAVDGLSLALEPGEVVGLVGPNGAGKTTTLRCVAGVIPATSGTVRVCGHDVAAAPVEAKRRLAFVSDEPRLFDHLTTREHLAFFARLHGVLDRERRASALLEELALAGQADLLPAELSRGTKQKAALACALLHEPRLLLLDEPLTGLDPLAIRALKRSLLARAAAGAALLLSSHLLALVEEVCSRVVIVDRGRVVAAGTVAEIRERLSAGAGASLEDLFVRITSPPAA